MTPAALLLRRSLVPLLVAAVGAGVVAAALAARARPGVDVALAFTVPVPSGPAPSRSVTGRTEDTALETVRAAEIFVDTLAGWLASPDFVARVYARAGATFPRVSVRRLSRAFAAHQLGGQAVDVRFRARSDEEARALAQAVVGEIGERADTFSAGTRQRAFRALPAEPLIVPVSVSPLLRGLVAGIVVFVLGMNGVLLWDFLRSPVDEAGFTGYNENTGDS